MTSERKDSPKLLTAAELADLLGTTAAAIYASRHRGDPLPPAVKVGLRKLRWRADVVADWLDERVDAGPRT